VGVLGVTDDVAKRVPSGFVRDDDVVLLLGQTDDELDGSEWAWVEHAHLGGRPPCVRLTAERALSAIVHAAAEQGLISSAHDLSDGGLSQALVDAVLVNGVGVHVKVAGDAFVGLFSESTARAIVTCSDANVDGLSTLAADFEVPIARLGRCGGDELVMDGQFAIGLDELRSVSEATLPTLFG